MNSLFRALRISILFSLICGSFVFLSCSNMPSTVTVSEDDSDTVKNKMTQEESQIAWTPELEKDILSKDLPENDMVTKDLAMTTETAVVLKDITPIYPSISGFGSLDISDLNSDARTVVNGFCAAISQKTDAQSYMADGCFYSLLLFLYDLNDLFPGYYKQDADLSEEAEPSGFFNKIIPGEPFIGDEEYYVPVRLENAQGTVDIKLYLNQGYDWRVTKIHIMEFKGADDDSGL